MPTDLAVAASRAAFGIQNPRSAGDNRWLENRTEPHPRSRGRRQFRRGLRSRALRPELRHGHCQRAVFDGDLNLCRLEVAFRRIAWVAAHYFASRL